MKLLPHRVGKQSRGESMTRTRTSVLTATFFLLAGSLALFLVLMTGKSSGGPSFVPKFGSNGNAAETAGEGPLGGYEAQRSAMRTYPANVIPQSVVKRARATFNRLAIADARRLKQGKRFAGEDSGHSWRLYGPRVNAIQPGVTSFSGATNATGSRTTGLVVSPDCGGHRGCEAWAGVSGGGVWRTSNVLAASPDWQQVSPEDLDQNSVGTLILDPTDNETLYLGTGEGNRCSSGCEAGVGVYKSTDEGNHWKKLDGACVSNATYTCANPGKDAFLGRGINHIVIDPRNGKHIFVGSAQAVRGLSHVIGAGGTTRLAPGSNEPGLYESTDGGKTFTEVWNGSIAGGFGVTDVGLDPLDLNTVYAAAFDAGIWRRSASLDGSASATDFRQVFAPRGPVGGLDRQMFALTVKNSHTRVYVTDGNAGTISAQYWRTDNANQPAATLLASEATHATAPPGDGIPYPANYPTWQRLSISALVDPYSPYVAAHGFCTGQCWYDQDVYTPAGLPDTVYVIGSNQYGEQPCNTKGVGCGSGRSNGREVLYSNTAGDPDVANGNRTFTDLSYDAQDTTAPWCAYAPYFPNGCVRAPNGIHPDQHEIVINPSNPTQIFEASDGGVIRTSGAFSNISSQCDEPTRGLTPGSGDYVTCKRLLSRVPTELAHIERNLGSTLQFINVVVNPSLSCEVMGGTQDNGTWSNNNGCSRNTFQQVIYGDGANAVYDGANPTWRANGFTSGLGDSNFRDGDPERWVITTAPMVNGDVTNAAGAVGWAFYWPQAGDPNPKPGTHPIYNGGRNVWRTWAFGAGHPTLVGAQDTTPDIAFYEAHCQEFVTSGANPNCGDYRPLGKPMCTGAACEGGPGDLTGPAYPSSGPDRGGGNVSWLARVSADHGTLWAATGAGRLFVSHNADAMDPATVVWHRIDNASSPTRYPSSIYVDPNDTGHAWVTYSGYNATTPTNQGHVFEVRENGAAAGSGTFVNLNVEAGGTSSYPTAASNGDLPVSDIVRDDATHTLYVSTDFGVLVGRNDGHFGWHVTRGMPRYEVMHLAIQPSSREPTCVGTSHCKRLLYAATHSQGIWRMKLDGHH
jgi:hypothetical protein